MSEAKELQEQRREKHIQEMKEQLRCFCGGSEPPYWGNFSSSKQEEEFLEHILFMEGADEQPLFDKQIKRSFNCHRAYFQHP